MENVIDNKNILNIIAEMSQQEIEKIVSIFLIMQKFESEKRSVVLPIDEVKEQGSKWLEALKDKEPGLTVEEKPHSIILNAVKNRCEAKIQQQEKAISDIKDKISIHENKIDNRKSRIDRLESKVKRYKQKINRTKTGNNFLQGILGGKHDGPHDGPARFIITLNKRKQIKLQKSINFLNLKITNQISKINRQFTKISTKKKNISDCEAKINQQRQKINKVNDIIAKDMPHVALSYFLSERSGLQIDELNKTFENPKEFSIAEEMDNTPKINESQKEREELISKLMNDVKSGEPEDYGFEAGLKEIEENLRVKSIEELQAKLEAVELMEILKSGEPEDYGFERQDTEDITEYENENLKIQNEREDLISRLMDDVKSGEPEDYGFEAGLKEIEENLWVKSIEELQADWEVVEQQNKEDMTEYILNESLETREQLELYAQFQNVIPTIGFDYLLENSEVKEIGYSDVHIIDEVETSDVADLKNKTEGVLYKEVTQEQLKKLDGQNFIFKRDDENPEKFLIKYNKSENKNIESVLKPPENSQPLAR